MEEIERSEVISPKKENWISKSKVSNIYMVKPGDSIWKIAQKFGTTMEELIELNNLSNPRFVLPGQEIIIPVE